MATAGAGAGAVSLQRAPLPPAARPRLIGLPGGRGRVRVARSPDEVESLRRAWAALPRDAVQAELDHFLWSLREEPQVVRPHVLAVEEGGRVRAILAARLSDIRLPCRLGCKTLYAPRVRAICVPHRGLLGDDDQAVAAAVVDELLAALDRGEADVVAFRQLALGSPLDREARARSTLATRQRGACPDLRWLIELPATPDEYLASLSATTRKGIRRTGRRLEQELGDRLVVRRFGGRRESAAFFADLEAVAARTYQRRLGVGYLGDALQRRRLERLMARGLLRGYVLYLDGRPVAFELGELYGGRFHSLAGGYDPAEARRRVGAHLLVEAILDLAADPAVSLFDFGLGDAEYKGRLAHACVAEEELLLYARRPRAVWINLTRSALLGLTRVAKRGCRRAGLLTRLKDGRRRRAAQRQLGASARAGATAREAS